AILFVFNFTTVAAKNKGNIVIVHGAWGGAWDWKNVDSLLTEKGYKVYRITLSGLGYSFHTMNRNIGLSTHILDVVHFIEFEKLTDVILLGHSYGGMVITGVADKIPQRIKQLVYIDALLPYNGESLFSLRLNKKQSMDSVIKNAQKESKNDSVWIPGWVKPTDPYPTDVPHPFKSMLEKVSLSNQQATSKIKGLFILTVDKNQKPEEDSFYPYYIRAEEKHYKLYIMNNMSHVPERDDPKGLVDIMINNFY
ncbi:MAG: alpha/beta hydrolase, partial [Sediminibacterium sp.]|nr:alpha/beta hydrolase [Sediminibacterium sp.]